MSRLERELDKLSVKEQGSNTKDIKDAIFLLNAPSEDLSVLRTLNLDHQINKNKEKVNISNKLTILSEMYNKKTYTGKQLKKLCLKYDLKILSSEKYKGKIDKELASKINEFNKENKDITISSANFFVLAVRESFKNKNGNGGNDNSDHKCLFFYRESPNRMTSDRNLAFEDDVFTLIHSWGKEYNTSRESRFLFFDSGSDSSSTCLGTVLSILVMLLALIFSNGSFTACWITALTALLLFIINGVTTKNYDIRWNNVG